MILKIDEHEHVPCVTARNQLLEYLQITRYTSATFYNILQPPTSNDQVDSATCKAFDDTEAPAMLDSRADSRLMSLPYQ